MRSTRLSRWLSRMGRQFCGPGTPEVQAVPLVWPPAREWPAGARNLMADPTKPRAGKPPRRTYQLEGPKPARMYEVILPKKLGYFGKVQEVLEDLFDEQAIRAIPFVKKSIAQRRREPGFDEDGLGQVAVQGLTRLLDLRDGRPLPLGARSRGRARAGDPVHLSQPGGRCPIPRTDFLKASMEVVNHLVAYRFAHELGVEEEIWFLQYNEPQLAIWRKKDHE